jgi:hypothetical protein
MDWEGAPWIGRVLPGSEAPGQPKQNKNKSWLQRFGTGNSLRRKGRKKGKEGAKMRREQGGRMGRKGQNEDRRGGGKRRTKEAWTFREKGREVESNEDHEQATFRRDQMFVGLYCFRNNEIINQCFTTCLLYPGTRVHTGQKLKHSRVQLYPGT